MARVPFVLPLLAATFATFSLGATAAVSDDPGEDGIVQSSSDDDTDSTATKKKKAKKDTDDTDEPSDTDVGTEDTIDLDIFDDDEGDIAPDAPVDRLQEGDNLQQEEPENDDYVKPDEVTPNTDFLKDDEETVAIGAPGQDSARIYRDYLGKLVDFVPDEEVIAWEKYLRQYPNTLFRDQISARMEELSNTLYDEDVPGGVGWGGGVDAGKRELNFATPLLLESIDPRTKLRAAFEWGIPSYLNLVADYEHQLNRNWSAHGGIHKRYTGWNVEAGTKYAIIKSARTNFLLTGIGDFHFNTDPLYPAFRPQIGIGKRFGSEHPLDLQLQGGVDFQIRSPSSVCYVGGGNINYAASDKVQFFVESSIYMKNLFWDEGGSFRFNLVTFGISFDVAKNLAATMGASAPYTTNYWGYHFGSVGGNFDVYME